MKLAELAAALPGATVWGGAAADVRRVIQDSRRVQPGDLFVAVPGASFDGTTFIPEAVARGAAAVAVEADRAGSLPDLPPAVGLLVVPAARPAVGQLADLVYGRPSQQLRLVGVTGTDGKTTTSQLIAHVLQAAGRRVGWLTTVDVRIGEEIVPSPFGRTTPEASEVHDFLKRCVDARVEEVVLEVSSHALALDRVAGCAFDAAVFTNLAPEHLDFHHSMKEYGAAKARLFEMLDSPTSKPWSRMGVVNADDPASVTMVASSPAAIVSYGLDVPADVTATRLELGRTGTRFRLITPIDELDVETRLVGRHNVSNWLAAAAVALGWSIDLEAVVQAAAAVEPPPGRFQRVQRGQPFEVIVDFAHTPQALATTLATARATSEGRVLLVFGMAGGRDAANRSKMGTIAARETDFFVISSDDPLHEDPAAIAAQVVAGARVAGGVEGKDFIVELDRRVAIDTAFRRAEPGDVVLLAGKGHERHMLREDRAEPWSDAAVAAELLQALGYG